MLISSLFWFGLWNVVTKRTVFILLASVFEVSREFPMKLFQSMSVQAFAKTASTTKYSSAFGDIPLVFASVPFERFTASFTSQFYLTLHAYYYTELLDCAGKYGGLRESWTPVFKQTNKHHYKLSPFLTFAVPALSDQRFGQPQSTLLFGLWRLIFQRLRPVLATLEPTDFGSKSGWPLGQREVRD